ncbi:hypothetical protein GGR50DRAFT_670359 [Xylaria sp. CBS 124048]|nr:hypothetical protein GGR50DRAFT_670359 [Xylaria sp. CBS 124048]
MGEARGGKRKERFNKTKESILSLKYLSIHLSIYPSIYIYLIFIFICILCSYRIPIISIFHSSPFLSFLFKPFFFFSFFRLGVSGFFYV